MSPTAIMYTKYLYKGSQFSEISYFDILPSLHKPHFEFTSLSSSPFLSAIPIKSNFLLTTSSFCTEQNRRYGNYIKVKSVSEVFVFFPAFFMTVAIFVWENRAGSFSSDINHRIFIFVYKIKKQRLCLTLFRYIDLYYKYNVVCSFSSLDVVFIESKTFLCLGFHGKQFNSKKSFSRDHHTLKKLTETALSIYQLTFLTVILSYESDDLLRRSKGSRKCAAAEEATV